MASAAVIKKLLLKYFREAPKEIIIDYLEIMFNSLSTAQKLALIKAAKNYLLPKAQDDLITISVSCDTLRTEASLITENADTMVSEAQELVDDIESL